MDSLRGFFNPPTKRTPKGEKSRDNHPQTSSSPKSRKPDTSSRRRHRPSAKVEPLTAMPASTPGPKRPVQDTERPPQGMSNQLGSYKLSYLDPKLSRSKLSSTRQHGTLSIPLQHPEPADDVSDSDSKSESSELLWWTIETFHEALRRSHVDWIVSENDKKEASVLYRQLKDLYQEVSVENLQTFLTSSKLYPHVKPALVALKLEPQHIIEMNLLEYLCYMTRLGQRSLPSSVRADLSLMTSRQQVAYQRTKNLEDNEEKLKGTITTLQRSGNPWEQAEFGLTVLTGLTEDKTRGATVAAKYLEGWNDNDSEGTREMFRVATNKMLADVILAFERHCEPQPMFKALDEGERFRTEEMKLLKLFLDKVACSGNCNCSRLGKLFQDCIICVPDVRRPQLLVFFLSTFLFDQPSAERMIRTLIDLYPSSGAEPEGMVISLMISYALSEVQRCLGMKIPSYAFQIIYKALIHSSLSQKFETLLKTFKEKDKKGELSTAVKANLDYFGSEDALGPFKCEGNGDRDNTPMR
ncbi:MAG: hypothetical protein M1816_004904 [Peltula sp. TS41687]|nr:MAG: hypothetical protein M1816_004904 [Peltula sp. TS41687]